MSLLLTPLSFLSFLSLLSRIVMRSKHSWLGCLHTILAGLLVYLIRWFWRGHHEERNRSPLGPGDLPEPSRRWYTGILKTLPDAALIVTTISVCVGCLLLPAQFTSGRASLGYTTPFRGAYSALLPNFTGER